MNIGQQCSQIKPGVTQTTTDMYREQVNIGSAQTLDEHLPVMKHNNKSAHLWSPIQGCAILKISFEIFVQTIQ